VERNDWGFASGAMIGALLSEVLRGALSRDGFWDRMERQRMPDPMSGTSQPGPWGRPLPGPWERPSPTGPWSGKGEAGGGWWGADDAAPYWDRPGKTPGGGGVKDGGGWNDGGFRTGGRESGGGFRSGGSF
jgi:hypothetical protein